MPKYDYRCRACGQTFEIVSGMNDARDGVLCQQCQSPDVFRLFGGIGTMGVSSGGNLPSMAGMPSGGGHAGGCCGGHC
jgi:putative FmdB family regulatory protein